MSGNQGEGRRKGKKFWEKGGKEGAGDSEKRLPGNPGSQKTKFVQTRGKTQKKKYPNASEGRGKRGGGGKID